MDIISSKDNKIIKLTSNLINNKKTRDEEDLFVIEGIKTINEINADFDIRNILVSEDFSSRLNEITCLSSDVLSSKLVVISNNLYKGLSEMKTPEGVMAIVSKKHYDLENLINTGNINKIVMLDDIRDPGNLGTIIRSADAMGIDLVITSLESVDLWAPKVTRSTMGSLFHMPIIDKISLTESLETLKNAGFKVYATSLDTDNYMENVDLKASKVAVIIGNEAHGVRQNLMDLVDDKFKIEMKGNAESLNASVAASIIMYELNKEYGWSKFIVMVPSIAIREGVQKCVIY